VGGGDRFRMIVTPMGGSLRLSPANLTCAAENEQFLDTIGKVSRIHCKKPKSKLMPLSTARANDAKSAVRARVEHAFAHQKGSMGLVIRIVEHARAKAAVTMVTMAYNMKRWCWLDRRSATA
jgi:transposase, IS5 family